MWCSNVSGLPESYFWSDYLSTQWSRVLESWVGNSLERPSFRRWAFNLKFSSLLRIQCGNCKFNFQGFFPSFLMPKQFMKLVILCKFKNLYKLGRFIYKNLFFMYKMFQPSFTKLAKITQNLPIAWIPNFACQTHTCTSIWYFLKYNIFNNIMYLF